MESDFMNNFILNILETAKTLPGYGPIYFVLAGFLILLVLSPWIVLIFLIIFKRYRVRFFGLSGEVISVKYYKKNSLIELPSDTYIPGYTFDGWYLDPEFNEPLSFNYVSDSNVKIYGKWIKNTDEI